MPSVPDFASTFENTSATWERLSRLAARNPSVARILEKARVDLNRSAEDYDYDDAEMDEELRRTVQSMLGEAQLPPRVQQQVQTALRSGTTSSFMPTAAEYEARRALDKAAKNAPKAPKVTARDVEPVPAGTAQLARAAGPLPASYSKKPEVRAVRYSSRSGSPVASPQNFGRGVATASDKRGLPKVYFYEENSPTGADKDVVATAGKTKYGARLSTARLYDAMGEDPLDYLGTINREKADQKLIDAGYAGLRIVSGDGRRIIALFEPVAQTEIGRAEKNEGKATVPKNAPQFMPATQIPDGRKDALRDSLARRTFSLRYNDLFPGQKADVDARVDAALTARASNKANTANSPQINTEAFKEWFGDWDAPTAGSSRHTGRPVSVVVDSAGVPLRVFHTTNKDFTTFEKGRPTYDNYGFLGDVETVRHAVFFSDSVEQSNDYGRGASGAQTKPVYLNIKSPVYLDSNTDWEALADETGVSARWLINTRNAWELLDGDMGKEFVEGLQRAGYDGAIFEEEPLNPESAPGKTYAVFDPAQIKSATGNRGTFDRSNPDIRFMPYAGPQADLDARQKDAFDAAKAMDDAGRDQEDIRAATGWFRGRYDDKWRYEVRDDRASLKIDSVQRGPTSLTLGEILDHPDLFAAYPELKRVRAYFSDRLPQGAWAVYNPQTKSITVDSTRIPDERVEQVIPLLLHEVQHWIQEREGFARGSDPQEFDSEDLQMSPEDAAKDEALTEEWDRLQEEYDALKESMSKIPESEKGRGTPIDRMTKRQERIKYLQRNLAEQSRAIRRPYVQARAEEAYRNSAGEIEARDVEFRRRWSPKRRAEVPPYTSEGIPKEHAGVYFMPAPPVDSEAFKTWFGNSKVVNADGTPKVMYHGSVSKGVTQFDPNITPVRPRTGPAGTYFTSDPDVADAFYTRRAGPGNRQRGEVVPVYLRMENPLDITKPLVSGLRRGLSFGEAKQQALEAYDPKVHDGYIFRGNGVNHDEYFVPDPTQIKSATSNVGTFDRNNSDIRFMPRPESPERKTRADIDRSTLPPGQARDLDSWVSTRIPWAEGYKDAGFEQDLIVGTEDVFGYTSDAQSKLNESIKDIPGMGDLKGRFSDVVYQFRDRLVDNLLLLHDAMPGDFRNRAQLWYDGARVLAERFAERYGVRTDQAAAVLATLSPQMDWYVNVHLADMVLEAVTQQQNTRLPEASVEWVRRKLSAIPAETEKSIRKDWPEEKKALKRANGVKAVQKLQKALSNIEGRTLAEVAPEFQPFWVRAYSERNGKLRTPTVTPEGTILLNVTAGSTRWQNYGAIAKAIGSVNAPDRKRISQLVGKMHKVRNFYNNILLPALTLDDVTIDTHAIAAALMLPYPSSADAVMVGLGDGGQDATSGSQGLYGVYADAYRIAAAKRGIMARQMQSITWEALRGIYLPRLRAKKAPVRVAIEKLFRERAKAGGDVAESVRQAIDIAGGFRLPGWFTGVNGYTKLADWQAGRTDAAEVDNTDESEGEDE